MVLDEFPWLAAGDPGQEETVRKVWDTLLEARPVLFIIIDPADTARMVGLDDAAAGLGA